MNNRRRAAFALACVVGVGAAGCGTTPSAIFTPDAHASATSVIAPTGTPVPGASGSVAVIESNSTRQGATYDIVLVDSAGVVHRRVTAKLPLIKPNQTIDFPLVSASDNLVYYLDGDTQIRSISLSGTATPPVKTLADGATKAVTFAVSPDNSQIAVSVMAQQPSLDLSTGRGYVEDLADSDHHLDLFANTGTDSFRWPVGWQRQNIVDAVGQGFCAPGSPAPQGCIASYHVIDSTNGHRVATACETAQGQSTENADSLLPTGLPTGAGTACVETTSSTTSFSSNELSVDWAGKAHTVLGTGSIPVNNCFLAPDAAALACSDNLTEVLAIVSANGTTKNFGRRYTVLGWVDAKHLIVDIDATNLGVLAIDTGEVVPVPFADASNAQLATTMPGGF